MENKNDDPKEVKLSEGLESIGAYAFQNAMITKSNSRRRLRR
jgi:hypothetical protein